MTPTLMAEESQEDFRSWASSHQLSLETIDVLFEHDINSKAALEALTQDDLPQLGLKLGQLALLLRLVVRPDSVGLSGGSATRAAISLAQNLKVRVYINIYNGPHEKP